LLPEIMTGAREGESGAFRMRRMNARKQIVAVGALLAIALWLPPILSAQQIVVVLDPAQTAIQFTLGATLHTVHGTFKLKSGELRFDPATGAAGGSIVIDVTTGDTGNPSRDSKMHREVLESEKYPEAIFTPRKVNGSVAIPGNSQVRVQGSFRIHGTDHDLTLTVPLVVKDRTLNATTQFAIPYVQWGMKDPGTFVLHVSDKVQMDISAAGRVTIGSSPSNSSQ